MYPTLTGLLALAVVGCSARTDPHRRIAASGETLRVIADWKEVVCDVGPLAESVLTFDEELEHPVFPITFGVPGSVFVTGSGPFTMIGIEPDQPRPGVDLTTAWGARVDLDQPQPEGVLPQCTELQQLTPAGWLTGRVMSKRGQETAYFVGCGSTGVHMPRHRVAFSMPLLADVPCDLRVVCSNPRIPDSVFRVTGPGEVTIPVPVGCGRR